MIDEDMKIKICKLPKWAREHIASLTRKSMSMERRLGQLKSEKEHGCEGLVYRGYDISQSATLLPDNEPYTFCVGEHVLTVRRDVESDALDVACNHGKLSIEPRATNRILMRTVK